MYQRCYITKLGWFEILNEKSISIPLEDQVPQRADINCKIMLKNQNNQGIFAFEISINDQLLDSKNVSGRTFNYVEYPNRDDDPQQIGVAVFDQSDQSIGQDPKIWNLFKKQANKI